MWRKGRVESELSLHVAFCDRKYASQSGLWSHRSVHLTENPLSCSDCGRQFRLLKRLQRHHRKLKRCSDGKLVSESEKSRRCVTSD